MMKVASRGLFSSQLHYGAYQRCYIAPDLDSIRAPLAMNVHM